MADVVSEQEGDVAVSAVSAVGGAPVGTERPVRIAVVGVSTGATCGVHDHAALLAQALDRGTVSCRLHWLWRAQTSLRVGRSEVREWARELGAELDRDPPDAVLLHYSVFAYSHRGVPMFVRPALSAVRRAAVPLIAVLHEFAYPWTLRGLRGKVLALTQRALLVEVVRASTAVILTADFRAEWIASRRWLPERPVVVAPVFSNLPPATTGPPPDRATPIVGLFGYASEGVTVSLTLDTVRLLEDRGVPVRLILLGAPGRSSAAGEMWLAAARTRQVAHALSFSGVLAAQELSDALAGCDVLLSVERTGPTSRKTTLAASLASGRPVIAIDGPRRWSELVSREAARVVAPASPDLADAIDAVLGDQGLSKSLGERGREFFDERMSVARSVESVTMLLDELLGARAS
jgi:glycosyltransferase involved in cell wall biosynthesis